MRYRRLDKQPVSFSPLAHPRDGDFHMNNAEAGDGGSKSLPLSFSLFVSLYHTHIKKENVPVEKLFLAAFEVASRALFVYPRIQTQTKSQNCALPFVLCRTSSPQKHNKLISSGEQIPPQSFVWFRTGFNDYWRGLSDINPRWRQIITFNRGPTRLK